MKKIKLLLAITTLALLAGCVDGMETSKEQQVYTNNQSQTYHFDENNEFPRKFFGHSVSHLKTDTFEREVLLYDINNGNNVIYKGSSKEIPDDIMTGWRISCWGWNVQSDCDSFGCIRK